jgi:hypothetical protein
MDSVKVIVAGVTLSVFRRSLYTVEDPRERIGGTR